MAEPLPEGERTDGAAIFGCTIADNRTSSVVMLPSSRCSDVGRDVKIWL
jgi:hypothetical protein